MGDQSQGEKSPRINGNTKGKQRSFYIRLAPTHLPTGYRFHVAQPVAVGVLWSVFAEAEALKQSEPFIQAGPVIIVDGTTPPPALSSDRKEDEPVDR